MSPQTHASPLPPGLPTLWAVSGAPPAVGGSASIYRTHSGRGRHSPTQGLASPTPLHSGEGLCQAVEDLASPGAAQGSQVERPRSAGMTTRASPSLAPSEAVGKRSGSRRLIPSTGGAASCISSRSHASSAASHRLLAVPPAQPPLPFPPLGRPPCKMPPWEPLPWAQFSGESWLGINTFSVSSKRDTPQTETTFYVLFLLSILQ